ncbi:MAG: bifunctional 4-hydroxy-2-oxoglutarate aldolase/2-dehydro-3-deoxy-phosphogluconate aldolase [Hyphomicrobiaceae bacterium]
MQSKLNTALGDVLRRLAVVPVLTIDAIEQAMPLAKALAAGGLEVVEVTLRTSVALEAIRRIRAEVPGLMVGAGTVLTPEQAQQAMAAGARFIVSPGMTPRLIEAAQGWPVPFLPGAVTASEAMSLSDLGLNVLKFFPAEASGGMAALKALAAPLQGITFCPTGGIDAVKAQQYLALPNVVAVGGSWMVPAKALASGAWDEIEQLARAAAALRIRV